MFGVNEAIGIDIGDDACRVVALRPRGGGYEVTFAETLPIASTAVADTLRRLNAARKRVAGGLPASGCAFKTASLPPGRPQELAQVVRFEAENQFPLPLPELTWDFTLTPALDGRTDAVIVGARRALVDERMALLGAAGVTPGVLQPAPMSAARTVALVGPSLLVLAGAGWTDLCQYDGDRLLSCRSVMAGAPDAEGWAGRIARELRPWLQTGEPQIVLLGQVTAKTAEALAAETGRPVTLGDPWHGVADPRGLLHALEAPAAFAAAVGLAQSALGHPGLNLLPAQVLETAAQVRRQGWGVAALVAVILLLIPLLLQGQRTLTERQTERRTVEAQLAKVRQAMPAAPPSGATEAHQAVATLSQPSTRPLEMLRQLSARLPAGILLTDFTYDRDKAVILKGRADDNAALVSTLNALNRMTFLDHASLDYAHEAKRTGATGYDFQITCTLAKSGAQTPASSAEKGKVVR